MKKILSIALVALLIVGSAFAEFKSGDATISLGYNLDTKGYGFANGSSLKYNFGFVLGEDSAEKAGTADLRAEIAATFKVQFKASNYTKAPEWSNDTEDKDSLLDLFDSELKITKANILYKDILTFGILNAGSSANFAESYYDDDDKDGADSDVITALKDVPGFTVSYKDMVAGGFGLAGNADTGKFDMLTYATLKKVELAEGLTAKAGAGVKLNKANSDADLAYAIQANAGIDYAKDLFSAGAAFDLKIADKFGAEIAANAKYDFVSLDIYYFTVDAFENNNLDAKLAAKKAINENVTLGGFFEVRNVIVEARKLSLGANAKVTVDAFEFSEDITWKITDKAIETDSNVSYKADMFTATAGIKLNMAYADDFAVTKIAPKVEVSSEKLIDGATVSLGWTGADFKAEKNGDIQAKVKISL